MLLSECAEAEHGARRYHLLTSHESPAMMMTVIVTNCTAFGLTISKKSEAITVGCNHHETPVLRNTEAGHVEIEAAGQKNVFQTQNFIYIGGCGCRVYNLLCNIYFQSISSLI